MKDPAMGGDAENCSDQKNSNNKRKREESKEEFKRPYLPIDDVRLGIKDLLMENPVNVIIAETGSGKSTQIPQICHQIGLTDGGKMIAVSQPRRVAAISLAHRVAQEMNSEIGRKVGYHVRFEQMKSDETRVLYLTDGMLLRETMNDVYLNDYSVVIIDEAHERSLHTDVLFAVLRTVQKSRKKENMDPLRIVIMSATLQAELFSEYFDDVPVYVISGRTFPVDVFYANSLNSSSSDYVYWSTITILQVHQREPIEDDVLVFLTGKEEIEHVAKQLKNFNNDLNQKLHVVPLYAALSPAAQMKAFQPAPQGHRKVILATNIAETSITIPGIRIVVDSGKVKTKSFTASDRTDVLKVHDISKSQAKQRAGRAGREAPGKCYRLYTESWFQNLQPHSKPEILRCNLSSVFLQLIDMGLKYPEKVKWLESPDKESIQAAIMELRALDAISLRKEGGYKLTEIGERLNKFPVAPSQARILLEAERLRCLEEALWIVSAMCVDSLFDSEERGKSEAVDRARKRFDSPEGDHISALLIMKACKSERKKGDKGLKDFCARNFISFRSVMNAMKIQTQLKEIAKNNKMEILSCGADFKKLREALAIGLFLNACEYVRQDDRFKSCAQPSVSLKIHPSSQFAQSRPSHFVFTELARTTDLFAREITIIEPDWVRNFVRKYANLCRIRDKQ